MIIKQNKLIQSAYLGVTVLAIAATVWLMAGTITGYFRSGYKTFHPSTNGLMTSLLVSLVALVGLWYLGKWFAERFNGWFVTFVILMSIPKFLLMTIFKLNPVSDMYSYNALGGSAANQDSWAWMYHVGVLDLDSIFPHVLHIANLYNFLFKASMNSPKMVQVFNIACSALTTLLILSVASYFFNRRAGMFASLVFFFMPTWYLYTTLIGAEPIWLLALFLSMHFVIQLLSYRSLKDPKLWGTVAMIIASLYFAQCIRPLSSVFAIGYGCFVWFRAKEASDKPHKASFWVPRIGILIVLFGFFTLNQLQPKIDELYFGVPIANAKVGEEYTLATGTNPKTGGVYNYNMVLKLEKYNHDHHLTEAQKFAGFEHVLQKQIKANANEIKAHDDLARFFYDKNETLMKPDYGSVLFYENTRKKSEQGKVMPSRVITPLTNISSGFQVAVLVLVLISLLAQLVFHEGYAEVQRQRNGVLVNETILIGMTIIFMLTEVQSRYQVAFYVPWLILAGLGMSLMVPEFASEPRESLQIIEEANDF